MSYTQAEKDKVTELLHKTIYGVSASEMDTIIGVKQPQALAIIEKLKQSDYDVQSLGAESNPPELVLYSIGPITP